MPINYHLAPVLNNHIPSWDIRPKSAEGYERLSLRFTQGGPDARDIALMTEHPCDALFGE
jgi:hypothetical protein